MKNGKVRQNRKKNSVYKKQKINSTIPLKNENSTRLKAINSNTKFQEILLIKKKRIKSKSKSISDKIIRKKNEQ